MKRKGAEVVTLLEVVLRVYGELRSTLAPIPVTPRHAETNLTDAAATLHVRPPTLSEVVKDLVRKRWVTKLSVGHGFPCDAVASLWQGHMLARHIDQRVAKWRLR